jgi:polar amino acid transport system substrate-binding protein
MYRRKPNRGSKPAKKAGTAAGIFVLLVLMLCLMTGCAGQGQKEVTSLDQLSEPGIRIGVPGTIIEFDMLKRDYPGAEVIPYSDNPLGYQDVASGRIDVYIYERREMALAIEHGTKGVRLLEGAYHTNDVAVGISPLTGIPNLQEKLNTFIAELRADGTLDDMYSRWVVRDEYEMPEIPGAKNPEYHLRIATAGTVMPYTYYVGTQLSGYDIELAYRFASWLGADVEFKVIDFGGIIAAAATGDVDCIMSDLYRTEENSKTIPFSDTLFTVEITGMVRDGGSPADGKSFWDSVAESFEKTFIRENRWQLFLAGIGTTLLITVLSILLGTALGFSAFLFCRKGNAVANGLTHVLIRFVTGLPTVVLLMVLYYIIFGGISISGTIVSVICFTLVFGSSVYAMVKAGVSTVDKGQTEAACSLGFTERKAFFDVVLPQALPYIMPLYREQIAALVKATSVVGYVAVQDLTKIGDIVRSRTFEAFFPLLAVAAVYFILADILTHLALRLEIHTDPKRRTKEKILKGVKAGD